MKATEHYFSVGLFIMLYKVVLTSESVDGTLRCNHLNKSSLAYLSCDAACFLYFFLTMLGIRLEFLSGVL